MAYPIVFVQNHEIGGEKHSVLRNTLQVVHDSTTCGGLLYRFT